MGKGDISKEKYDEILNFSIRCSQWITWAKYKVQDPLNRISRTTGGGVTCTNIGNFLEGFNIDILSTLSIQLDVLQVK